MHFITVDLIIIKSNLLILGIINDDYLPVFVSMIFGRDRYFFSSR